MPQTTEYQISAKDRRILRGLAARLAELSADPVMDERRAAWKARAALKPERPMILAEIGGVMDEVMPLAQLQCEGDLARGIERGWRGKIYSIEVVKDDSVVDPWIEVGWHVSFGDYGVKSERHRTTGEKLTSYRWTPPIKDLQKDLGKLHFRSHTVDREGTMRHKAFLEENFGDIMPVKVTGRFWWTMGMTWTAIDLIGLENLMLFMYDDPDGLHGLMKLLRDDHIQLIEWCEREGLLTLNNGNEYIGSGSLGFTDRLPAADWKPGMPARLKDLWGLSESQETVGVGPDLFAEFIFPYQLSVIRKFGLCYYGCCEPVHSRWHVIKAIPNLLSVSVSPWCDQEFMARELGNRYVFCRKPNPALISRENFNEDEIRADLRHTLDVARGCTLELVMKDVHTLANCPQRLARWVEMAREECERSR